MYSFTPMRQQVAVSEVTHLKQKEEIRCYKVSYIVYGVQREILYKRNDRISKDNSYTLGETFNLLHEPQSSRLGTQPQQREYVTPEVGKNTLWNIHSCILPIHYYTTMLPDNDNNHNKSQLEQNDRTRLGSFKGVKNTLWEQNREQASRRNRYQAVTFNSVIVTERYSYL